MPALRTCCLLRHAMWLLATCRRLHPACDSNTACILVSVYVDKRSCSRRTAFCPPLLPYRAAAAMAEVHQQISVPPGPAVQQQSAEEERRQRLKAGERSSSCRTLTALSSLCASAVGAISHPGPASFASLLRCRHRSVATCSHRGCCQTLQTRSRRSLLCQGAQSEQGQGPAGSCQNSRNQRWQLLGRRRRRGAWQRRLWCYAAALAAHHV